MNTSPSTTPSAPTPPSGARLAVFAYSLVAYAVGMGAIAWLVARLAGAVPVGAPSVHLASPAAALAANLGLLVLFGLQHSVMARPAFKAWWTRRIAPAAERSTYVLAAGVALGLLLWLWQPMRQTVWSVPEADARIVLWALFAGGWLYLVASTYATDHCDLFGLRQAWLYLRARPYTPVPFVRRWTYRFSRHPMMAGLLVGVWATPDMTSGHLLLAAGFSVYIGIGVAFEERGLRRHFGEQYERYRQEVGALVPRFRP